jgi:POT family proton-dependent oligopeptide transporter
MIMSLYLLAVFVGNIFTAQINKLIQIPSAAAEQFAAVASKPSVDKQSPPEQVTLAGYDGVAGTSDDYLQHLDHGIPRSLEIPGLEVYQRAAASVEAETLQAGGKLPPADPINALGLGTDPWGNPLRYEILNSSQARIFSAGPDQTSGTKWDQGLTIEVQRPAAAANSSTLDRLRPDRRWLDARKEQFGIPTPQANPSSSLSFTRTCWVGGQSKLQGAAYFRFFTILMLVTALAWLPFAFFYRPKTYLQE